MSVEERFFLVADDRAFDWLRQPALRRLFSLLNRDGQEVRVVGGAVRNTLMGIPIKDIDCATTAEPSLVMDWARAAGVRFLPTGVDHGTVTLLIDDQSFEVTTLRRDVETDGRRAEVAFGKSWSQDAQRRDFAMNALYLDHAGRLFDPTGRGLADAKTHYLRFIGDPKKRIEEDYLRVLRFFRFLAQYGEHYRAEDYLACIDAHEGVKRLSAERVGSEMVILLQGDNAQRALELMVRGGLLPDILACVPRLSAFARLVDLSRQMRFQPSVSLLLTILCVEVAEDAHRLARKLRLPNRVRNEMITLCEAVRSVRKISERRFQQLAYRFGKAVACDLVLLAVARRQISPDLTSLSMMMRNLDLWQMPVFPLNGRDLLDRGYKPGPDLGAHLSELEQAWVDSDFVLSKNALLAKHALCG